MFLWEAARGHLTFLFLVNLATARLASVHGSPLAPWEWLVFSGTPKGLGHTVCFFLRVWACSLKASHFRVMFLAKVNFDTVDLFNSYQIKRGIHVPGL